MQGPPRWLNFGIASRCNNDHSEWWKWIILARRCQAKLWMFLISSFNFPPKLKGQILFQFLFKANIAEMEFWCFFLLYHKYNTYLFYSLNETLRRKMNYLRAWNPPLVCGSLDQINPWVSHLKAYALLSLCLVSSSVSGEAIPRKGIPSRSCGCSAWTWLQFGFHLCPSFKGLFGN